MANKRLQELQEQVQKALALCDQETADGLIGAPQPDEYGTLVRGVQGVYHMLWMMAKGNGMKETKASLKMGAQAMVMLLQLVHYAYALVIRQGKGQ